MNGYRRLTLRVRYQIELLKGKDAPNAEVARQIGIDRSSVGRELKRLDGPYNADKAHELARQSSLRRSEAKRIIKGDLKSYVDDLIKDDLSPEQASNVIKIEKRISVSIKTIYRYIERDKLLGGQLKSHLRLLRIQRNDRKKSSYGVVGALVKNKTPMSERPRAANLRSRIGDYERDTVLGTKNGRVLLTIVDRKTRYIHLACLARNGAELAHQATVKLLRGRLVKTITNDNGTEFAFHKRTAEALNAKVYFSRSYRSWERGTNENLNGLLRQYFPKRKEIPDLTDRQLRAIERKLNRRPRKILGYKTPEELYTGRPAGRLLR